MGARNIYFGQKTSFFAHKFSVCDENRERGEPNQRALIFEHKKPKSPEHRKWASMPSGGPNRDTLGMSWTPLLHSGNGIKNTNAKIQLEGKVKPVLVFTPQESEVVRRYGKDQGVV